MTEPQVTVLSVRGDAELEVAPDLAEVPVAIELFASSKAEVEWNEKRQAPTGRIGASVEVDIRVRDLAALQRVSDLLAQHESVHVQYVRWAVDDDNPAWPVVRAAAIEAAIQKGRDYAAALGGTLTRIDHVADIGLLGGDNSGGGWVEQQAVAVSFGGRRAKHADDGDAPSLDPVPQLLRAAIEARFTASVRALA